MRRTASEVIRELETRIARLERSAGRTAGRRDTYAIFDEVLDWAHRNEGKVFSGRRLEVHFGQEDDGLCFLGRGDSYDNGDFVRCNYLGDLGEDKISCVRMVDFEEVSETEINASRMSVEEIISTILKMVKKVR